jgi:hypothetical protein
MRWTRFVRMRRLVRGRDHESLVNQVKIVRTGAARKRQQSRSLVGTPDRGEG